MQYALFAAAPEFLGAMHAVQNQWKAMGADALLLETRLPSAVLSLPCELREFARVQQEFVASMKDKLHYDWVSTCFCVLCVLSDRCQPGVHSATVRLANAQWHSFTAAALPCVTACRLPPALEPWSRHGWKT